MRDPKTEKYLSDGGYHWVFQEKLPLEQIDLAEARTNPARLHHRLDEDRVTTYGVAMLDGADFPGIVVFDDNPKKHLVTGLHRIGGAREAAIPVLDAYLVAEPDDYRRYLLTLSINSIEGRAPSMRESLNLAFEALRKFPEAKVDDVAKAFYLKPETLRLYQNQIRAEERAVRLGIGESFCLLPAVLKLELDRIQSDVSFARAANALVATKGKGEAARTLAKDVKAARTEEAAQGIVEQYLADFESEQERNRARFGKTPTAIPTRFISRVKGIIREQDLSKLALAGIPAARLGEAISVVEQGIDMLTRVRKLLLDRQQQLAHFQPNSTRAA